MTKEQEIQKNMKVLGISREDAEELWRCDHDLEVNETEKELTAKAKSMRRYEKSDKPRKASTRERKVDETKKRLLMDCKTLIEGLGAVVSEVKTETEITFTFCGEEYSLKLIKHRKK